MENKQTHVIIIAGPNGAGRSATASLLLRDTFQGRFAELVSTVYAHCHFVKILDSSIPGRPLDVAERSGDNQLVVTNPAWYERLETEYAL